jgi:DNA-directed RNA polymerase subunit M/transcription elongation factor TFIIS
MYYLKIREEDGGNSLNYYCRNCGHEDTTLTAEAICVSETQLRRSEQKYTHMVNEYTKFDPTLPRINTIKCPNQECSSNADANVGSNNGIDVQAVGVFNGGDNGVDEAIEEQAGGAGEKKTVTTKAATAAANKKKTAKTLLKEAEEEKKEAEKSAKETKTLIEKAEKSVQKKTVSLVNNREVIYIRYDDINMKYVYLCVHCDTTWKTDNRT